MSSYRPIDSKREEFRKYLERTGVMDALTKALVALYEEADKPDDALGYIKSYLGGNGGNGGGSADTSKGPQKQVDDPKVKSEKTEASVLKGGGDHGNTTFKTDEAIKHVGESHVVGAEGDAPTISKELVEVVGTSGEMAGKRIAEFVPPKAVA